jgi:GMP synthase (glutamine-hydrolysing)
VATELVVLQHHPRTGPSAFTEVLDGRTHLVPWRGIDVAAGDPLPDVDGLGGVLVMGGPMGLPDADEHAWMDDELTWLSKAVDAGIPVLGICLGAQLLASALGGTVERMPAPRIGYLPVTRTESAGDDEVAAGWPDGTATLFFHEDDVATLPDGAEVVLEGPGGPAAWCSGSGLAVHFHPEVTLDQLTAWLELPELRAHLDPAGVDADELLDEASRRTRFTVPQGRALVGRWIDGPVRKHVTA